MKKATQHNAKALQNIGSKVTKSRLRVLELFDNDSKPLFVEDIYKKVSKEMNQSTLYRILAFLETKGEIVRIHLETDRACYEKAGGTHHHHILCTACGDVEDIDSKTIENALHDAKKASKKFSTVSRHSLEFFGTCKSCAKK